MAYQLRYSTQEIVSRGQTLYETRIRETLQGENDGKFLALDIETGEYELDQDELTAVKKAKARRPDAPLYILRVGYPSAHRLGGGFRKAR